jgi:hypothetical protein
MENAEMIKSSWQRFVSWTGIALVLLNVLVPTLSHAMRAQDPALRHAHREMVLAVAGDLCVSAGVAIQADDLQVIERAVALTATLEHLKACDFCDEAPIAGAVPVPLLGGFNPPPQVAQAVRFQAFAARLLHRAAFELPASRAPPQV